MTVTISQRRVLVVEDEPDLRATMREVLEGHDYFVAEAADGLEARKHLAAPRPCLVILDLLMPIVSGWDFLTWLGTQPDLAAIKVIVFSAAGRDLLSKVASCGHVVATLSKPVRLDDLLATIERYC